MDIAVWIVHLKEQKQFLSEVNSDVIDYLLSKSGKLLDEKTIRRDVGNKEDSKKWHPIPDWRVEIYAEWFYEKVELDMLIAIGLERLLWQSITDHVNRHRLKWGGHQQRPPAWWASAPPTTIREAFPPDVLWHPWTLEFKQ